MLGAYPWHICSDRVVVKQWSLEAKASLASLRNKETFGTIHFAGGETRSYRHKLIAHLVTIIEGEYNWKQLNPESKYKNVMKLLELIKSTSNHENHFHKTKALVAYAEHVRDLWVLGAW